MADPGQQGEIWTATSRLSGRTTTVVLLDSDVVIRSRPMLVVAPVRPAREVPVRQQLLTVPLPSAGGVVALYDIAIIARETLTHHDGHVGADVLDQIRIGLRARFDL